MTCVIRSLNLEIRKNFQKVNIRPRPTKSNGLWCGFVLPTILLIYTWQYDTSHTYRVTAYLGAGLMLYNLLFIFYIAFDCLLLTEPVYAGCMFSMIVSSVLMVAVVGESLPYALSLNSSFIFLNYCILRYALNTFPRTFTLGEITIVVQGIVLFLAMSCTKMLIETTTDDDFVNTVVYFLFIGVAGIVGSLYNMTPDRKTMENLKSVFLYTGLALLALLHTWLGETFILQCIAFVVKYPHRMHLIAFWATLAAVAAGVIWMRVRRGVRADTANRKIFHLLASLVFASGTLCDEELMRLAAGAGLALLVMMEALRKSGIPPISNALEAAFTIYKDDKDNGAFAMTPLYLYCGLACPLLLVPGACGGGPARLAGVLACGAGDAAASWLGAKYGRVYWPGSNKTVEGTIFNVLAQLMVVAALVSLGLMAPCLKTAVVAACCTAFVEARTEQVDNLVLPLIALLATQLADMIPFAD